MHKQAPNLECQVCEYGQTYISCEIGFGFSSHLQLAPLFIPPGTLKYINKVEHTFLWVKKVTTTGAKCKVHWEAMLHPEAFRGFGVLHMENFATALRLRWPWRTSK
jgi:hypothetical protein